MRQLGDAYVWCEMVVLHSHFANDVAVIHQHKILELLNHPFLFLFSVFDTTYSASQNNIERVSVNTVEPPNKRHFGNKHVVLFLEAVPISEACHCLTI